MNQTEQPVLYRVLDGTATITLNRPEMLNAMNNSLMSGLSDALQKVKADTDVRVVVLTGNGRGFCSGADLAQVAQPDTETQTSGDADTDGIFNTAIRDLNTCPVPTIARINGPAAGGGFGLALACDITIASSHAFFIATFGPRLGIVPDMGATWSIPMRVGRARALGITLLGERITAAQALAWGLIWSAVEHEDLDAEVSRVAQILKRSSPNTVTRIRQTIDAASYTTFSDQLNIEMQHQAVLIPRNMREGALAFMEKREPLFGNERDQDT
ncbi:MAG: enoyl-CoA hydratase-related protein [Proteobacteria bacterium]|nr:enoyl-CoA hydratase-related protein [Pseudomonadota bacterium]